MMDINSLLGLENIKPEDIGKIRLQLQEINDAIRGGLRSANLKEYRNTYVINAQDSLDASFPMYVHFNIIPEMVKIVSINVSFWFQNFRAYATAASSGGAVSSASGGGETPTSSSGGGETPTSSSGGQVTSASGGGETPTSSSGGAQTSGSGGGQTSSSGGAQTSSQGSHSTYCTSGLAVDGSGHVTSFSESSVSPSTHTHTVDNHTHTVANHTHSVADHTHTVTVAAHTHTGGAHTHTVTTSNHTHTVTVAAHTHTGGAHTHGITYGIYEDSTSPTVMFYVSRDNGLTYSLPVGSYTADHENLDITSMIDTAGGKLIKFTSNARTRLSVQITISLNIKVR